MVETLDDLIEQLKEFAEELPTLGLEAEASMIHMNLMHLRRALVEALPTD